MSRVPSLHRHMRATVHFNEPDHLSPAKSSQDLLCSPSMLLVSGPEPTHADMQDTVQPQSIVHSSKQSLKLRPTDAAQSASSKAGNVQKKGGRQQQSEVRGRRMGTPSRIPVKQQTATRNMSRQTQPARRDPRAEQLPQPVPCDAQLCRVIRTKSPLCLPWIRNCSQTHRPTRAILLLCLLWLRNCSQTHRPTGSILLLCLFWLRNCTQTHRHTGAILRLSLL